MRERQLIEHWRPALKPSAKLRRFYGDDNFTNRDEAVAIVQYLLPQETFSPQLAQELCVQKRKLGDTAAGVRTVERMRLDLAEKERQKANLAQAASEASMQGQEDVSDEQVHEIAQINAWFAKLTRGVDCLEGRQRFEEPWWKRGGGVNGTLVGTA